MSATSDRHYLTAEKLLEEANILKNKRYFDLEKKIFNQNKIQNLINEANVHAQLALVTKDW